MSEKEIISYAFYNNANKNNEYWEISISDYKLYSSEKLKTIYKNYRKIFDKKGIKIVFTCNWNPNEKELTKLLDKRLILNI